MVEKISSGIKGLDAVLEGGYLKGSPTILKGGPGTGKTVLTLFFAHSHLSQGKKVIYLTCDESPEAIERNMEEFGLECGDAVKKGLLQILDLRPNFNEEIIGNFTGEYELSTVLMRVQEVIDDNDPIIIVDSLQNLLMPGMSRVAEKDIYKLFDWSRQNNITLLVTDVADSKISKVDSLEEYATDCVISVKREYCKRLLTRYLTVEKMRGSAHGTNRYPYCISKDGILLLPRSGGLKRACTQCGKNITGIPRLDMMLGGGIQCCSFAMFSGTTGTAKTLFAASIADYFASNNQKVLFISFEEQSDILINNVKSIGIDLQKHIDKDMLEIMYTRPSEYGLEQHLLQIIHDVEIKKPKLLIIDPFSSFLEIGDLNDIKDLVVRFSMTVKRMGTTIVGTELVHSKEHVKNLIALSSIVDTLIQLRQIESNGEFNRIINVRKSRGSSTSNQMKEFHITDNGIVIEDPYIGIGGMIFGSAKQESMMTDEHHLEAIKDELHAVNSGLDIYNQYHDDFKKYDTIKLALMKQQLIDKKLKLEKKLQDLIKLEELNKKSRE